MGKLRSSSESILIKCTTPLTGWIWFAWTRSAKGLIYTVKKPRKFVSHEISKNLPSLSRRGARGEEIPARFKSFQPESDEKISDLSRISQTNFPRSRKNSRRRAWNRDSDKGSRDVAFLVASMIPRWLSVVSRRRKGISRIRGGTVRPEASLNDPEHFELLSRRTEKFIRTPRIIRRQLGTSCAPLCARVCLCFPFSFFFFLLFLSSSRRELFTQTDIF